jgi:hypothetical protein
VSEALWMLTNLTENLEDFWTDLPPPGLPHPLPEGPKVPKVLPVILDGMPLV